MPPRRVSSFSRLTGLGSPKRKIRRSDKRRVTSSHSPTQTARSASNYLRELVRPFADQQVGCVTGKPRNGKRWRCRGARARLLLEIRAQTAGTRKQTRHPRSSERVGHGGAPLRLCTPSARCRRGLLGPPGHGAARNESGSRIGSACHG